MQCVCWWLCSQICILTIDNLISIAYCYFLYLNLHIKFMDLGFYILSFYILVGLHGMENMISRPISKIVTWGVKITGPQDSFYSRSKNIIKCNEIIVNQPQVHITQLEYGIDQISFCISTIQCHKSISSLININKLQIAFRKHNINLKAT